MASADEIDESIHELAKSQKAAQESYRAFNKLNPLSEDFSKQSMGSTASNKIGLLPEPIQTMLNNPGLQKAAWILFETKTQETIKDVATSPNRLKLAIAETVLFFAFILFRSWRRSKLEKHQWLRGIWMRIWTFFLYVALGSFALPIVIIGEPFSNLLSILYRVLSALDLPRLFSH